MIMTDYQELKARYDKLCAFLARVEDGSSPIHDDTPVAELYQQKAMMENMLAALEDRHGENH